MSQPDRPEPRTIAWCSWHNRLSDTALLVRIHDQGSGTGGGSLYACARCRQQHGLTPMEMQS